MLANNHDTPEQQLIQFQNKNYSRWQSQKDGDSANKIILKEHLHCSKDVLHSARRSILKDLRDEEMLLFVKTLCDFQNWTNIE